MIMGLNNIDRLIEKYENGYTTLEEEQELRNYFSGNKIAPHLEVYKPLFEYFLVGQQEGFTKRVIRKNALNKYKWVGIAAIAVIMLGVVLGQFKTNNDLGTYEDPEMAFREFSKSMEMISKKFNQGTSTVRYLDEINKGTATLGYLNEIENTTSIIFKKTNKKHSN